MAYNKVILIGRLVADPELKKTPSGVSVTSFSLAVDRRYNKDEEKKADFISVVAWRNTAEFICKYFKKGAPILVEGELQTRSWEDQSGGKRYATEVVVSEARFVGSKSGGGAAEEQSASGVPTAEPKFEEIPGDDDLPF